mmetsp:Transcript_10398/g.28404  ORF Transcript_10398/g.28404 Transcript_10398/m.28404 type:complete len:256 (+) Transcript_10398:395-1162(+)
MLLLLLLELCLLKLAVLLLFLCTRQLLFAVLLIISLIITVILQDHHWFCMHNAQNGTRQADQGQEVAEARTLYVQYELELEHVQQREDDNGLHDHDGDDGLRHFFLVIPGGLYKEPQALKVGFKQLVTMVLSLKNELERLEVLLIVLVLPNSIGSFTSTVGHAVAKFPDALLLFSDRIRYGTEIHQRGDGVLLPQFKGFRAFYLLDLPIPAEVRVLVQRCIFINGFFHEIRHSFWLSTQFTQVLVGDLRAVSHQL